MVITDLGMPDMDGYHVARAIKAESPRTPILMLTGWGTMIKADGESAPEVDAVLSKPPRMQELNARLAHEESKARDFLALTAVNARRWFSRADFFVEIGKGSQKARLGSWPRQCMNKLTAMRRNMPKIHAALRCLYAAAILSGADIQPLVESGSRRPSKRVAPSTTAGRSSVRVPGWSAGTGGRAPAPRPAAG